MESEQQAETREPRGEVAALLAELVGTAVVTFASVAPPALVRALGVPLGYPVAMACPGIATMMMIYSFRHVSGAHLNPCLTVAFAIRRDFAWRRVPGYLVMQSLGALGAGALVLWTFHPDRSALLPEMQLGAWTAFRLEIVLTVILVVVALSTANVARFIGPESAIANGATTVVARWIGGHVSSGSMNPARTLGPAVVAGGFGAWWVYVTAPLIGTAIALILLHTMWRDHPRAVPDAG